MKKKLSTIMLACAAILAVSCSKENYEEPQATLQKGVERDITITAQLPGNADKAALNTSKGKIIWELGDQINVNGTNFSETTLYNENTNPTASFGGTAHAIPSGDREIYWAVYPTTLAGAYNNGVPAAFTTSALTFTLPATQTFDETAGALSGYSYMAGYAKMPQGEENVFFCMHNLGAILHLNLTALSDVNSNVARIEFTTTNGALAGDFTIANDTVTITPTNSATKVLTVNLTDGTNEYINIEDGVDIYVALPPMASKDLTMRIYNTDGKYTEKTSPSVTFRRSYLYHNTVAGIAFEESEDKFYFTAGKNKKLVFSPGNLEWSATNGGTTATTHRTADGTAAGTWRFAEHQWSYVGTSTYGNVYNDANIKSNNAQIGQNYQGWIDLFGWGTSGYNNKFPYMTVQNNSSYGNGDVNIAGTYYDWGLYNDIYNPVKHRTDPYGTWRTPTKEEWDTIHHFRTGHASLLGAATVNEIKGIILLPDNWNPTYPAGFRTFNPSRSSYNNNVYTAAEWEVLEQFGAIFIPSTYNREGTTLTNKGSNHRVWSSTKSGPNQAWLGYVWVGGTNQQSTTDYRYLGEPVRLIREYAGD